MCHRLLGSQVLSTMVIMSVHRTDEFGVQRMGDITYTTITNRYRACPTTDGRSEFVADLV